MWIGYYLKHIWTSIRRKPLQPLLSVLIFALSCMLSGFALNVYAWLKAEKEGAQAAQYGRAVVTATLDATSQNRFLQAEDVYVALTAADIPAAVQEEICVAGTYELPLYCADEFALAVATDFNTVGGVFDLAFSAYGEVTDKTEGETAFITADFAEKYSLSVGSALQAELLGREVTYTVQGISEQKFMDSYEVMVSVSGVVRTLAADYPFLAALGDDFKIFSNLYIAADKSLAEDIANAMKDYSAFADKTVTNVSDLLVTQTNLQQVETLVNVLIVFVELLALSVVSCCFYILSAERTEENGLFVLAGAPPKTLLLLQCSEILFYAIPGAILGLGLCALFAPLAVAICGFEYITPFIPAFFPRCAVAAGATLVAALLTAILMAGTLSAKGKKHERTGKKNTALLAVLAVLAVISFLLSVFTPADVHLIFASFCLFFFLCLLFIGVPPLFSSVMRRAASEGKKRPKLGHAPRLYGCSHSLCRRYAVKNARNVKTLHNSCRLAALLFAIALTTVMILIAGNNYIAALYELFPADYMVLNVSESAAEEIKKTDGIESVYALCWRSATDELNNPVQLLSADDPAVFASPFQPNELPAGDNASTTTAYAKLMGVSVGDTLTVTLDGEEVSFIISSIFSSPLNGIYIDAPAQGIPYNLLVVKGEEGIPMPELRGKIASAMSLEMPLIVSVTDYMESKISVFHVYNRCGNALFYALLLFSLTGIVDNLFESYRSRRETFLLYENCGMTKKDVARMKAWEIGITIAFALPIGILGCAGLFFILQQWMESFSVDLIGLLFLRI
jgi:ABC-type antimicrobial peptide transport system permease subunit